MSEFTLPRVALAVDSRSQRSMLAILTLILALRKKQIALRVVTLGSSLNLSLVMKRSTARSVVNVDFRNVNNEQALKNILRSGLNSELLLFISDRAFLDGASGASNRGSLAELCALTATPVIYLSDNDAYSLTTGSEFYNALVQSLPQIAFEGFLYAADLSSGGYTAEQIEMLVKGINPNFLGVLSLPMNLQLKTAWGTEQLINDTLIDHSLLNQLAKAAGEFSSLDRIVAIAQSASNAAPDFQVLSASKRTRIAVSEDLCFGLNYQTNCDLLRFYGAEIVAFSPLSETQLPSNIGGIYLTGAFLNEYADDIFGNQAMKNEIKNFVNKGGALFSEGLSTAYLFSTVVLSNGEERPGVGLYQGTVRLAQKSQNQNCRLELLEDSLLGQTGSKIAGRYFDDCKIEKAESLYRSAKIIANQPEILEGYSATAQSFSTFALCDFSSNELSAKSFAEAAEVFNRRDQKTNVGN